MSANESVTTVDSNYTIVFHDDISNDPTPPLQPIPEPAERETKGFGSVLKTDKAPSNNVRKFIVSDEAPDRVGDVVKVGGWELDNFLANPVIMLRHGLGGTAEFALPIGKAVGLYKRSRTNPKRLEADVEFLKELHPLAETVMKIVDKGLMGTSVALRPIKWEWRTEKTSGNKDESAGVNIIGREFQKQELVEISVTATPQNPRALRKSMEDLVLKGEISWKDVEDGFEAGLITEEIHDGMLELKPKMFDQEQAYSYILRDMKRFKERSVRRFLWKNELPRVFGESGFLADEERGALHRLIFPKGDGWTEEEAEQYVSENAERIKEFVATIDKDTPPEQIELQTLLSFCRDVESREMENLKEFIVPLAKERIAVLEEELFPTPTLETRDESTVDDGETKSSHEVDESRVRSALEKMNRLIEESTRRSKLKRVVNALKETTQRINT